MEKEIVKKYKKGDFSIVWKPKTCIHDGTCVRTLPNVYDPKGKPWIKQENASVQELKSQIENCPSGALSYEISSEQKTKETQMKSTKVLIKTNGPLLVYSDEIIIEQDGSEQKKERVASFCRCGASQNKPFCDGEHKKIGFEG
ncbi:(4Fe-4S)-binding protein [Maribacter sp. HTCC2170]|uniref:(4Fe-4S)-binding protein n=1 Tax=Maribacter sp. (strain HTCC2170 / KCCM 42371) TaxID=313603 RepID=UPI00006BB868|nr:(4Fe-4S)-binding protein [Maribacter sp. HTCC2170]EAQ99720.1 hypothetical protein FB2170_10419 [Maribacter sp. HTCC2170]